MFSAAPTLSPGHSLKPPVRDAVISSVAARLQPDSRDGRTGSGWRSRAGRKSSAVSARPPELRGVDDGGPGAQRIDQVVGIDQRAPRDPPRIGAWALAYARTLSLGRGFAGFLLATNEIASLECHASGVTFEQYLCRIGEGGVAQSQPPSGTRRNARPIRPAQRANGLWFRRPRAGRARVGDRIAGAGGLIEIPDQPPA